MPDKGRHRLTRFHIRLPDARVHCGPHDKGLSKDAPLQLAIMAGLLSTDCPTQLALISGRRSRGQLGDNAGLKVGAE